MLYDERGRRRRRLPPTWSLPNTRTEDKGQTGTLSVAGGSSVVAASRASLLARAVKALRRARRRLVALVPP
ncbi:hypothetical protein E2C01_087108 [Portunus trituberculatus]|uniref:Uncharacterized protein n=1 Tax=Portunus trituberculatus TaxID=210409 RepID=A0A5B7JGE8_PORTR|nr:hypothetical protein [Portunus trituberculatus]